MLRAAGSAKIRKKRFFNPESPHENVDASSLMYRSPQTFSSPGFPYANGIFPTTPALGGPSEMFVSRENRSTRASICWLDSKNRSRLLETKMRKFRSGDISTFPLPQWCHNRTAKSCKIYKIFILICLLIVLSTKVPALEHTS
jgi:hypothetical protein